MDETINICRQLTDEPLLFRLDSGNDSAENIGILLERGCYFIIKRNLRKESKEDWLQMVKDNSKDITHPRDGKAVYIGSDWKEIIYQAGDGTTKHAVIRMGYEIIERTIDKKGSSSLCRTLRPMFGELTRASQTGKSSGFTMPTGKASSSTAS